MTIEELLRESAERLKDQGYVHGEREAQIMLSEILDIDTNSIFARYEENVVERVVEEMEKAVQKRLNGAPLAYITGHQPFMGWDFITDERGLIPRPETEHLVEALVKEIRQRKLGNGDFLEIGTGAGPIAIALKKYFPNSNMTATDISNEALDLAQDNAQRIKVDVDFIQSDLFENVPNKKYDLIVANLPYVPTERLAFVSDQILDWEPMVAIEAGEDGLKYITPFIEQLGKHLKKDGIAAIEMWHTHGDPVRVLAKEHLPNHEAVVEKDLAGFDRFTLFYPN